MKRILKQLWQLIFKHKKRLIYWALAFFVGQICFFNLWWVWIQSEVYAADGETATQREEFSKVVTEKAKLFDLYRKTGYVLLYPVVFLAGKLVDNSFVYWEVFGFDAVLWKLWNMVRNFANFWLWFIFLYYIFRFLIKNDKNKDWKRLIWRAMIAWIGIQASWFIMAALIDVSTILIYWIWGLPLSILWWDGNAGDKGFNPYVLKTVVTIDADNPGDLRGIYLTSTTGDTKKYISECETMQLEDENKKGYIVAPKLVYYWNGKKWTDAQYVLTEGKLCHYFGSVYKLENLPSPIEFPGKCWSETDCINAQLEYETNLKKVLQGKKQVAGMLPIWVVGNPWLDEDNMNIGKEFWGKLLSDLVNDDMKSYVWVFSTLYSSLLEAWRKMGPMDTGASNYVQFLSIFMALAHVIAIWIPLLAALLVFIMRIWVLWVAIVISPMIILLEAFGFMDKVKTDSMKYFKLSNLIWIIFAPAVITFAVSLSTVLVRLIEKINYEPIATDTIVLWWLVEMNLAWFSVWLAELIIAVMWAAISRFLVWTAVEMSALWGGWIVKGVKELATSALWSVPIVPIVWRDANWKLTWELASVSWVKNAVNNKIQSVKSEFGNADTKAVQELFSRNEKSAEAAENKINHTSQTFVDWLKSHTITSGWRSSEIEITGADWKPQKMIFNNLDWAQKEKIVEKINSVGGDLLEKIWKATPDIDIDGKVKYVFKEWKFERQETQK